MLAGIGESLVMLVVAFIVFAVIFAVLAFLQGWMTRRGIVETGEGSLGGLVFKILYIIVGGVALIFVIRFIWQLLQLVF